MTTTDQWLDDAFFERPVTQSLDGGTTSAGTLWHGVSPRWGHSMHAMCSYHGMFPAKVAHYFIQRFTRPGDLVVDPFSGRGTTALQARVEGRRAIGNDLSPLAHVLTASKVNPPSWSAVNREVDRLEREYRTTHQRSVSAPPEIEMLYHHNTLAQLHFMRQWLLSSSVTSFTAEKYMIAGALAGIMHGAWRRDGTSQYLSISMPNTFSMAPTYVEKFIREKGLKKLDQDVFERLRDKLARLYVDDIAGPLGHANHEDATAFLSQSVGAASIDLLLTSPPYLRVVNYATANWIRLWLFGLEDVGREQGAGRQMLDATLDHRHTYATYKDFMLRTFLATQRSLKPGGVAVFVIGDVASPGKDPVPLAAELWSDVGEQTDLQLLELIEDDLPAHSKVSRIWGDTKGQATNRDCALVLSHRDTAVRYENDDIQWEEPYLDAGPDAAHDRLRTISDGRAGATLLSPDGLQ